MGGETVERVWSWCAVPASDAGEQEFIDFAHTYDGYSRHGGLERLAGIVLRVQEGWRLSAGLPDDLAILRGCLFYEARAHRHRGGELPFHEDPFVAALIVRIRKLSAGSVPLHTAAVRRQVAGFWDEHVRAWLDGADPLPPPLAEWFAAYHGSGSGAVTRDGFCEPYIGDLLGAPRMVVLGLNPGAYVPAFQSREGIFAREIRAAGGYTAWAASGPYVREPWTARIGPNRYHRQRIDFARRWLADPAAGHADVLVMEAYPWHSSAVTATMRPPAHVIDQFVWAPLSELDTDVIFAFGLPWQDFAAAQGLALVRSLGAGGEDYGSAVPGRAVREYRLPAGQRLVVEWHPGGAGPPAAGEVTILKNALGG